MDPSKTERHPQAVQKTKEKEETKEEGTPKNDSPNNNNKKNMLSLRTHGLPLLGGHLVHLHSLPSGLEATGLATTTASVIAARCLAVVWSPPFMQLREPLNWL